MSASAWVLCPKCGATNPDCPPPDECAGTVRVDHEFSVDWEAEPPRSFIRISFWCTDDDCNFVRDMTEVEILGLPPRPGS